MAAYAALLSLAQTTDLSANQDNQYRFSFDAESKIRSIHEYVNFLLSFLENFPEKATSWEDKVREVAHKIEDIIQHYMWQQMKSMRPSSVIFEGQLNKLTEEIGLIVGQMMEERPAYLPAAAVSVSSPAASGKDAVIGLEADVTAIKIRLCGQSSKLQVAPIVGMAGIGKTTLARAVYDDPYILYHFHIRAWVTVSQDYSPHKLRKILLGLVDSVKLLGKELSGEKIHESGEEEEEEEQVLGEMIEESDLRLKVKQSLMLKRYLIVIDDVWRTDVWDDLRNVFPDHNNGSRIMLTTRLLDVATYPDFGGPLHEMRFMDDFQSWDLLKQKVFTNSSNTPPELEDVGKEIARKCAGLPLAVVLVAGVLSAANITQAFWKEIARNVNPVVKKELEEILSFSYTHLPHHLRPCFLYIGGFPEDEEIHASRLIKLWVAEGFLKHQLGCSESLEDEAEVYLDDLVKRNLVLVTSRKTNGKIKSCSLHDTVRDMCVRKALEEKFLRVLDGCHLPQGVMNERRISFNHSDINGIFGPTIRSILCFQLQSFPGWEAFLGNSTLLKVLNGVGSSAEDQPPLPSQVFDLFHLTHLVLIGSFNIPSAISNLVNLQTFIIHPTFRQRKRNWRDNYKNASHFSLPLEIWRMRQLRHLILSDLYVLPPPPDGSNLPLEKLQTLSPVENLVWSERMLQMIPNVKKLGLSYSRNKKYHLHHLNYLHQLEKLQVTGYNDFSWRSQNRIAFFSRTLQKLSLVNVIFPWEDMAIVGSLPNLQVLKLLNHACDGETWETDDDKFPQLKFLLIDTSRLRQWTTQGSSSFPMLRCLVLRSCAYLEEIPESIGKIPTLERVEVYYCTRSLVELVEQIREEQQSYGNDALQVRMICSDEVRLLPSVAAYDVLLSLAQTTDLNANQDNQYSFSVDAESKIRSIHEYVNFLLSFLENFPEKATRWEHKVREVAHKIEDIIHDYVWQQMKSMRPSSEIFEDRLQHLTEEIGLIVGEMMEERPAYLPAAAVSVPSPATAGKDAVISLQDDVTAIKDRLFGQSSELQVVPIVGVGGIGKTTLARTVYHDPLILNHFDIRAWVTVSQDNSPHKLRKILLGLVDSMKLLEKELSREKEQVLGGMIEESQLQIKLYQSLKWRRYLIVMDDIWRTDVWDVLRNVFPNDNNGSRIMLTTRLLDVATYPDFSGPLHEMRFMDDHQSWDLLKQKVFTNSTNFQPELEDIGKEIARKCAGLPLAVVLVAGVLSAANTTQDSWEEIARNVKPVVKEELEEILSFSYTHLPLHLRPCFLFIGGFPEDKEIHASRLIKLWVAEGFLKHQFGCSRSLEDEAEVYLDDLVKRNLVLVNSRKTNGKIKSCSLHDTVRDMCVRKAREALFLQVLDGCNLPQGVMDERRISLNHSNINGILGPTIRSILCFQHQSCDGWEAFLGSSTLLKVLNGVGFSGENQPPIPSQVFDLFHLTHLVLIGSFNIPSAISNLVNLQTLIIQPTFGHKKRNWSESYKYAYHFTFPSLPLEIWRMRQLRHLILNDLYVLPPPPDGSNLPLEKLQTLSPVKNLVWNERMVQMIPNVKKLGLVYSRNEDYHLHHLNYLHQFENLRVTGYKDFSWRKENLAFSTTLKKLSLVGVKFPWEDMGIIGTLPNLQVLKLLNDACGGETWETGDGEFPQLKFLLIDTSCLRQWTTQGSSSFPMLRCLVLRSCWYLKEIPESIGEIPTLELIEVYSCTRSLAESVEQIRKDQHSYGNDAFFRTLTQFNS